MDKFIISEEAGVAFPLSKFLSLEKEKDFQGHFRHVLVYYSENSASPKSIVISKTAAHDIFTQLRDTNKT